MVKQQFEVARQIIAQGLVPIVEPEVSIKSPTKREAEAILRDEIAAELDRLPAGDKVMLKLTIPTVDDFYAPLVSHPSVIGLSPCLAATARSMPARSSATTTA